MFSAFKSLSEEKQMKIIDGCIYEFSKYGYEKSSTNRIIKKVGISKGSLFNYFHSKEDLYFYILDYAVDIIEKKMFNKLNVLPDDLFKRIYTIAELEYDIYVEQPALYNLFKKVLTSDSKEIIGKIYERYSLKSNNVFMILLGDFNTDNLKWEQKQVVNVIKWVLTGLNDELLSDLNSNVKQNKKKYLEELNLYLDILKEGIIN